MEKQNADQEPEDRDLVLRKRRKAGQLELHELG
jgi:hypothetical protein